MEPARLHCTVKRIQFLQWGIVGQARIEIPILDYHWGVQSLKMGFQFEVILRDNLNKGIRRFDITLQ